MRFVTTHNHQLRFDAPPTPSAPAPTHPPFQEGLELLGDLLPGGLAPGAIHEVLTPPRHRPASTFALLLARHALARHPSDSSALVWFDPARELYPPALAAAGIPMDRLLLIQTQSNPDQHWAAAECLRCRGVAATVFAPQALSRVQARRLQLAAEQGRSTGILLRTLDRHASTYAASTRWLVEPHPGDRTVQRWTVQLIHGHGRLSDQPFFLELSRENHSLRAVAKLADRPGLPSQRQSQG